MSTDKELEIRSQFLDEAQEYLSTLEDSVLGIASSGIDINKVNAALRAAHSVKGGAGMMGFLTLSHLSHRLEDSLKVLKVQKASLAVDAELEGLLLGAIDNLHQVIRRCRQDAEISPEWLETQIEPIFDALHDRLGDPQSEDASSMLSPEDGQNILALLFETEVESSLQRLELVLQEADPRLREEVLIMAQELAGLGEMLQLPAFSQLCESITWHLEAAAPDQVEEVTRLALQNWRRSQSLVLTGNLDILPTELEAVPGATPSPVQPTAAIAPPTEVLPVEVVPAEWTDPLPTVTPPPAVDSSKFVALEQWEEATPLSDEFPELDLPFVPPQTPPTPRRTTFRPAPRHSAASSPSDPATDLLESTVRVPFKQLNEIDDLLGELTLERNTLDLQLKRLRDLLVILSQRVQTLEQSNQTLRSASDRITAQSSQSIELPVVDLGLSSLLRIGTDQPISHAAINGALNDFDALEMDRYNPLHLISQEVMETIVQLQEVTADVELGLDDTDQTTRELNKTARQLQRRFTQVRMRPLSDVVDRFPRALRELSLQHGKPVELKVIGGSTLIDRNILEAIAEPLMHLLRNAFDHGIEDPETRRRAGKPEQGLIEIRAMHRGDRTCISLRDDGRGIALEKIRARACQMGLDEALLAAASDEELLSLIFEPGFSTSDQVTDLSGRGVGMDVVRNQLQRIRGDIQIDTQAGVGTTFLLSVPYNFSISRVLLVESNGLQMAVPSEVVEEMVALSPDRISSKAGQETFTWQGKTVHLVRLHRWLHFNTPRFNEEFELDPKINAPTVLVVAHQEQHFGLEIDRSWGTQDIAIRQPEGPWQLPPGFSGCTILGDGRVVPLLNPSALLHWMMNRNRAQASPPLLLASGQSTTIPTWMLPSARPSTPSGSLQPTPQEPTILVVDDSINVRRFLSLTLEKAGYRVEQARDGQDALDKLTAGLMVQAIVCDIEMPRLDGYGLLAQIRANPTLGNLPVTMLTSRSGNKHRQLAMNLGANAYFSKPYNEQSLLQTLNQLTQHSPAPL